MAVVDDWMKKAAEDIADHCDLDQHWDSFRAIIERHCPFERDTAYEKVMPVLLDDDRQKWLIAAAREITNEPYPDAYADPETVKAIINRHCPFNPNVTYVTHDDYFAIRGLLMESKRKHYHCDDSFFCCRLCDHPDHGGQLELRSGDDGRCNCGADQWNARVDEALGITGDDK